MSKTYSQIYIHAVFAVKYRNAIIEDEWKGRLFSVIGELIKESGCKLMIVNGVSDHVHCLYGQKVSISTSEVMKVAKAKSSRWINKSGLLDHRFAWQRGFGAFSYSQSQVAAVYKYIQNQEAHHQDQSFLEEYVEMLNKFNVPYEERNLFKELI